MPQNNNVNYIKKNDNLDFSFGKNGGLILSLMPLELSGNIYFLCLL